MERLNPSQVFGDIMVDYSYVECTSACLQALVSARAHFGDLPGTQASIERGGRFLLRNQRPDGSFEGSWGVCFTYGTWFAVLACWRPGWRRTTPRCAARATFYSAFNGPTAPGRSAA